MTTRDAGETGIALIGVYFGTLGLIRLIGFLGSFALPPAEGISPLALATSSVVSIAGELTIAALCVTYARTIAARTFSERTVNAGTVARRDLLRVGLILLGVSTVMSALPAI